MIVQATNASAMPENLLTVPIGKTYGTTTMIFANYTAGTIQFWLYVDPAGGIGNTNGNILIYGKTLTAHETYILEIERLALQSGTTLYWMVDTPTSATATISYIEI